MPTARIVDLPGANVYMFLTHEADVLREVRAFAASLPPWLSDEVKAQSEEPS